MFYTIIPNAQNGIEGRHKVSKLKNFLHLEFMNISAIARVIFGLLDSVL